MTRLRSMSLATLIALTAGTGVVAPAQADPMTDPTAVTVIIPVTTDTVTVTVSRNPAPPTSTTPLVTPPPPAPRPQEPAAPASPAVQPVTAVPTSSTTPPAPPLPAETPTVTVPSSPSTLPVATGTMNTTAPVTDLPTPAPTQAPPQHTQTIPPQPTQVPTQAPPQHTQTIPAPPTQVPVPPLPTTMQPTTVPLPLETPTIVVPTEVPKPDQTQPGGAPGPQDESPTAEPSTTTKPEVTATTVPPTSSTTPPADGAPQAPRPAPDHPQAPTSVTAAQGRRSGLPWVSGTFAHSLDRVGRYEAKTGRPVDTLTVFPGRGSWGSIMDTWWMARPEGFTGTLDVGVPLWQEDGDLATAAQGGYNAQWEDLGRTIQAQYPGSTVRIGWEFNLGGWNHHATDENVEEWKQAFRHASTSLKKGGPSLLVVWNPNKGKGDSLPDASKAWPGDDVVDIVAIDAYDWWPKYDESTWPEHRDGDQGWRYWIDFTRAHGKKFGLPEWGVAPGNANGGGDNPYFIQQVMGFLAEEHAKDGIVYYTSYFDEPDGYIANSIADGQVPQAGAALKESFDSLASSPSPATAPQPAASPTQSPTATTEAGGETPSPAPSDSSTQAPTSNESAWAAPNDEAHGPTPQG